MPLYFAYGSNMSPRQMQRRCPGAQAVGVAALRGWRFIISTRGGANVVPDKASLVYGVLWHVEGHHLADLDGWEGVSAGVYRRLMCYVQGTAPSGRRRRFPERPIPAVVYISAYNHPGRARRDYIETAILPGARAFAIDDGYANDLRLWLGRRPIGPVGQIYRGRRSPKRTGRRR